MKTYIVYFDGIEHTMIKAGSHNTAEKKARKLMDNHNKYMKKDFPYVPPVTSVMVSYTEI